MTSPGDIAGQLKDTSAIERSIQHMQNDMIKLNLLLHRERGIEQNLQQSNVLMENDFIGALKVRTCCAASSGVARLCHLLRCKVVLREVLCGCGTSCVILFRG